jgi:diguanylate cyclase (GGDEF)-like protein
LSISDGLTGLYNQSYFFKMLDLEVKKSKRHNVPFSLVLFDVDHFKEYNDHNGHIEGSAALKQIAKIMKEIFRVTDILAKYGGDEFVVILPNSDKVGAFLAADRLREMVEMEGFPGAEKQPMGKVTLSLGIASYPEHGLTGQAILESADKAMYVAKEAGRNRTFIFNSDTEKQ